MICTRRIIKCRDHFIWEAYISKTGYWKDSKETCSAPTFAKAGSSTEQLQKLADGLKNINQGIYGHIVLFLLFTPFPFQTKLRKKKRNNFTDLILFEKFVYNMNTYIWLQLWTHITKTKYVIYTKSSTTLIEILKKIFRKTMVIICVQEFKKNLCEGPYVLYNKRISNR